MRRTMNKKLNILLALAALCLTAGGAWAQQCNAQRERYVIQGDTVYDKKTDLTWARCSVGQRWKDGVGCVGVIKVYTFDQAQSLGSNGWRVPSKEELVTFIIAQCPQGAKFNTDAFTDTDMQNSPSYWTNTPSSASGAWFVHFGHGNAYSSGGRSYPLAVRLVRGGQ